jgi:hypothetical protein
MVLSTDEPTMRRENKSSTVATYKNPSEVRTKVMSLTHALFYKGLSIQA